MSLLLKQNETAFAPIHSSVTAAERPKVYPAVPLTSAQWGVIFPLPSMLNYAEKRETYPTPPADSPDDYSRNARKQEQDDKPTDTTAPYRGNCKGPAKVRRYTRAEFITRMTPV